MDYISFTNLVNLNLNVKLKWLFPSRLMVDLANGGLHCLVQLLDQKIKYVINDTECNGIPARL